MTKPIPSVDDLLQLAAENEDLANMMKRQGDIHAAKALAAIAQSYLEDALAKEASND